jgi:uncharacterized membrane protein
LTIWRRKGICLASFKVYSLKGLRKTKKKLPVDLQQAPREKFETDKSTLKLRSNSTFIQLRLYEKNISEIIMPK